MGKYLFMTFLQHPSTHSPFQGAFLGHQLVILPLASELSNAILIFSICLFFHLMFRVWVSHVLQNQISNNKPSNIHIRLVHGLDDQRIELKWCNLLENFLLLLQTMLPQPGCLCDRSSWGASGPALRSTSWTGDGLRGFLKYKIQRM